ncbi:unnamed protein product [Pleuronectes platessa]|uniref:Uncharacterized protein n=1 Tax=Pleuronectes platessa TaxID=8262 RepID=A0A9N7W177_PLEPL|nr:unnamed protein product [Pleuronectes platessa]
MPVQIPDDSDFSSFKDQCLSTDGWISRYSKGGVTVWCREEESRAVQKLKVREGIGQKRTDKDRQGHKMMKEDERGQKRTEEARTNEEDGGRWRKMEEDRRGRTRTD